MENELRLERFEFNRRPDIHCDYCGGHVGSPEVCMEENHFNIKFQDKTTDEFWFCHGCLDRHHKVTMAAKLSGRDEE